MPQKKPILGWALASTSPARLSSDTAVRCGWRVMNPRMNDGGLQLGASCCNRHHDRCPGDIDSGVDVSVHRHAALLTDKGGLTLAVRFCTVATHMARPGRIAWVNS